MDWCVLDAHGFPVDVKGLVLSPVYFIIVEVTRGATCKALWGFFFGSSVVLVMCFASFSRAEESLSENI